jgi:hypothetical protein
MISPISAMNASSLCQLALILQTSSSALESPARKAAESAADSAFLWLLISSALVAVGIGFEYPEVKLEFKRWLRARKRTWIVDPDSPGRVPLWALIGFLIVIIGVAGEGVFEGILGIEDTAIRKIDEQALKDDELTIAQLQNDNLKLQKLAGDAATAAQDAKDSATQAKDAAGKADGDAKDAEQRAQRVREEAVKTELALQEASILAAEPRRIVFSDDHKTKFSELAKFANTPATILYIDDDEAHTLAIDIGHLLVSQGWKPVVVKPILSTQIPPQSVDSGVWIHTMLGNTEGSFFPPPGVDSPPIFKALWEALSPDLENHNVIGVMWDPDGFIHNRPVGLNLYGFQIPENGVAITVGRSPRDQFFMTVPVPQIGHTPNKQSRQRTRTLPKVDTIR